MARSSTARVSDDAFFAEVEPAPAPTGPEIVFLDKRVVEWGGFVQATPGSAAYDLFAAIDQPMHIGPGAQAIIGTGIKLWIKDPSLVALVFPRSGLGTKGIVLGNLTGVIDSDYQGQWMLTIWNRSNQTKTINPGDRVAQVVFTNVSHIVPAEVEELSSVTTRGEGGLGSTGQ